jgi:hypothetical protein
VAVWAGRLSRACTSHLRLWRSLNVDIWTCNLRGSRHSKCTPNCRSSAGTVAMAVLAGGGHESGMASSHWTTTITYHVIAKVVVGTLQLSCSQVVCCRPDAKMCTSVGYIAVIMRDRRLGATMQHCWHSALVLTSMTVCTCCAAAAWDSVKWLAALGDGINLGDWHPGI